MSNVKGLVVELVLPAPMVGDKPRALRQFVIFDGIVLERQTTNENRRRHWRAARYGEGKIDALDVSNEGSWLGAWIRDHDRHGYEVYGRPFLVEANPAEKVEIDEGNMPRALALRIGKARTEIGVVTDPWTGE